ncbi:hypothetical protein GCM10011380_11890 [Sphingomonas metalli]|uniref:Uncharacterized protein n=1 Tax=Sphingomonas metalli TaxID=1779358 RepID=A0A916WQ43_9SPHN|nr:hypothetical protein [Sphingomonas metalli]GGB23848.1 hypothetical protein GCM10011380_11890 [Sphingomonas metalli]
MNGRPLRFLAATLGGWSLVRLGMLWPVLERLPELFVPAPPAEAKAFAAEAGRPAGPRRPVMSHPRPARPVPPATPVPVAHAGAPLAEEAALETPSQPPPLRLPDLTTTPEEAARLTVSLWGIARGGVDMARPGSQLGGSQAGVRATWLIDRRHRLALSGRVSGGLDGRSTEAAVGIDWQPVAAPVHLLVEQRVALGRGRGGPAALVVAGLDPRPLARGLRIEGYGQAGVIGRDGLDGFADGAARVTRRVQAGALRLDLSLGAWGGAQRGAARVDVGPSAGLALPIGGHRLRLTLDWRQRIAGRARPGSGPALSVGMDF